MWYSNFIIREDWTTQYRKENFVIKNVYLNKFVKIEKNFDNVENNISWLTHITFKS